MSLYYRHCYNAPRPKTTRELISALHDGGIFVVERTEAASEFVALVRADVQAALSPDTSTRWSDLQVLDDPYPRLSEVRSMLASTPRARAAMVETTRSLGMSDDTRVDAPRLRCISAGAEHNPAAAPVYVAHRDTWYGCPNSLLVAWIPLQDTPAEHCFAFYPSWFAKPLHNSSDDHDHSRWMREVGWHGDAPLRAYAAPKHAFDPEDLVRFDVGAGDIVLFSAAQLHQTLPMPRPKLTRYSIDFRILPTGETAAPNVDNLSVGAGERVSSEFGPLSVGCRS